MLILTLVSMGVATVLIGLLPTYASLGVAAPIVLVACRLVQGIAIGGEWGGAVLMATEYSPSHMRGFYGSMVQIGFPLGMALGTASFFALAYLTDEQFTSWGWRTPFLASAALVVIGIFIRLRIEEFQISSRFCATATFHAFRLLRPYGVTRGRSLSVWARGLRRYRGYTF